MTPSTPGPQTVPIAVKVTGDKAGLARVKSDFLGLAGDLAEPMILLASGASKAEAAFAGIKGAIEFRVLGPLALVAGASASALIGINRLAKGYADFGMEAAGNLEAVETRFKTVLKSQELAAERMRENVELARSTPYTQDEVMEGNRALEILTQGALSTVDGMKLVGDATAVAGREFSEVAKWVGRLYDGLQSGTPIGMTAMRLQQMGLITGNTKRTLESMQEAGAGFSEMWGVVESQLKKSEGAMKDLSKTLEGLQSTLGDSQKILAAKFSEGFLEGEISNVESAIKLVDAFTPTVETLGKTLGTTSNAWSRFQSWIIDTVTEVPGFSKAMTALAVAVTGVLTAFAASGALAMLKFAAGIIAAHLAKQKLIKTTGALIAVQSAQKASVTQLTAAKVALSSASAAVSSGNVAEAATHVKVAAAHTLAAGRASAGTVASLALGKAAGGLIAVLRVLVVAIRGMLVSLVTHPIFLVVAALVAASSAMIMYSNRMKEARERAIGFNKATKDIVSSLEAQQRAIATTTDLMRAHMGAVTQLANARKELIEAEKRGSKEEIENAKARVDAVTDLVKASSGFDRSKLALDDDEKQRRVRSADEGDRMREHGRQQAREKMSPQELAADLQRDADEAERKLMAARAERAAQKSVQESQSAKGMAGTEDAAALSDAEARLAVLRELAAKEIETARSHDAADKMHGGSGGREDAIRKRFAEEEAVIVAEANALRTKVIESRAGIEDALSGKSQVEAVKGRISLRNQYDEVRGRVESLEGEVEGAGKDADPKRIEELDRERASLEALVDIAKRYRVALDKGAGSIDETDLTILQDRLAREEDLLAVAEKRAAAEKQAIEAGLTVANDRLDTERAILGLKELGLIGDLAAVAIEQQKLDIALKAKRISEEAHANQMRVLAAERESLRNKARERSMDAVTMTRVSQLRAEEEMARRLGDVQGAADAARKADALEIAKIERQARNEAKELYAKEADRAEFVRDRVAAEKRSMEQERQFREEDAEKRRQSSRDSMEITYADLRASILRQKGETDAAKKAEATANQMRDDRLKVDQRQRYIDEGFGASDADSLSDRDVMAAQAERELQKMRDAGTGTVIAASLARIGGGGRVVGTDPVADRIDKTNSLLAKILQATETGGRMR